MNETDKRKELSIAISNALVGSDLSVKQKLECLCLVGTGVIYLCWDGVDRKLMQEIADAVEEALNSHKPLDEWTGEKILAGVLMWAAQTLGVAHYADIKQKQIMERMIKMSEGD